MPSSKEQQVKEAKRTYDNTSSEFDQIVLNVRSLSDPKPQVWLPSGSADASVGNPEQQLIGRETQCARLSALSLSGTVR